MFVINILIALIGLLYWYVTGDIWPAVLGGALAVIVWDEVWLLSIVIAAAIMGLCTYYFWTELFVNLNKDPMLKEMGVTVLYMTAVFFKAYDSFRS